MKTLTTIFSIRIDPTLIKEFKLYCLVNNTTITACITKMIIKLINTSKRYP